MKKMPRLSTKAVCITNSPILGAVISLYFAEDDTYLPIFKFPEVLKRPGGRYDSISEDRDDFVSQMIGNEAATLIHNAIERLRPAHVIIGGLDEAQLSYLDFLDREDIIHVESVEELPSLLGFLGKKFAGELRCCPEDAVSGLLLAYQKNLELLIDGTAPRIQAPALRGQPDVLVIEGATDIATVISVAYGLAIRADIHLVPPLEENEIDSIKDCLSEYGHSKSDKAFDQLKDIVRRRVGQVDFSKYRSATFFTKGLPYGLALGNIIPFCHVMRDLREDFLVFNGIYFEGAEATESAVMFSPLLFPSEETKDVSATLRGQGYYVAEILGPSATVRGFDNYAAHYPYDLMHICSHGGETDGYYVTEVFTDRDGKKHTVEYEEVIGLSKVPGTDKIEVMRKAIFRKFDGMKWMSSGLRGLGIPSYVFEDMRKEIFKGVVNEEAKRTRTKGPIRNSCHVKCYDSLSQGTFRSLAAHRAPLVFNNTCASWWDIAIMFLAAGCRGYVGTLWNIENDVAVDGAKAFYAHALRESMAEACWRMNRFTQSTGQPDIYLFWGLHITSLEPAHGLGRKRVLGTLVRTFMGWRDHVARVKTPEVRRNGIEVMKFIYEVVTHNFPSEDVRSLGDDLRRGESQLERGTAAQDAETVFERGVLDLSGQDQGSSRGAPEGKS